MILTPTPSELEALLREDVPMGDLTTEALGIAERPARMSFAARDDMVVAGIEIAAGLVRRAGGAAGTLVGDGVRVAAGTVLLEAMGRAGTLHAAWKQAQTVVEILSGIASAARAMVEAATADGRRVPVACTRKTLAGARRLQMGAARVGGCVAHRLGLSETVLVFAEHRAFLDEPLEASVARLRARAPEKKLVIEVASADEAEAAAHAGFDVLQLEKCALPEVEVAVARARAVSPTVMVAAAGGVNAANAGAYVAAGVHLLVTSWPYQAPPRDVSVTLVPA